ncbi:ATP-binding cassette domain-containing protein [Demequina salsinemoris]|uniref:ATP-binding cassette domain-containing protein n=1 Tax=Demequina salsinemoris TaxID=577470 RepID=UPI0007831F41|nr:ATP-binding cassette domain-containing protein [Demequina salsinemoris]
MTTESTLAPTHDAPAATPPVLDIRAAGVSTRRASVYGPLDARISQPITLVLGDRGSGRTSLLLSVGGRMRLSKGSIRTLGYDVTKNARRVRNFTALAGFDAIDRPDGAARIAEVIRERQTWLAPWYRRVPAPTPRIVHDLLAAVYGDVPVPTSGSLVRDLTEGQELLLRVALALIEEPRLLLVDDLDDVKNPAERAKVAARLQAIALSGIAVVVGSADPRDAAFFDADLVDTVSLSR